MIRISSSQEYWLIILWLRLPLCLHWYDDQFTFCNNTPLNCVCFAHNINQIIEASNFHQKHQTGIARGKMSTVWQFCSPSQYLGAVFAEDLKFYRVKLHEFWNWALGFSKLMKGKPTYSWRDFFKSYFYTTLVIYHSIFLIAPLDSSLNKLIRVNKFPGLIEYISAFMLSKNKIKICLNIIKLQPSTIKSIMSVNPIKVGGCGGLQDPDHLKEILNFVLPP